MISEETYKLLNNSYKNMISYEGIVYPSVENAFQASRFVSTSVREKIASMSPGEAANMSRSRQVKVQDWENRQLDIMYGLLKTKFSNPELKDILVHDTNNEPIIMQNGYHENEWGTCMCHKCNNTGHNRLGRLLMELRSEFMNDSCETQEVKAS